MQTTVINCPMCGSPMYISEVSTQGHTWKCWSCGYVHDPGDIQYEWSDHTNYEGEKHVNKR